MRVSSGVLRVRVNVLRVSVLLLLIPLCGLPPVLHAQPQPRVYRDRVRPHWSADARHFWYRVDLPGGRPEFVEVDVDSGQMTRESVTPENSTPTLFLPRRASGSSAEETQRTLINQLPVPVRLLWIDSQRTARAYGELEPGATREQHTFVSHVWLVQKLDGTELCCVEAEPGGTTVTLNDVTLAAVRQQTERGRRSDRSRAAEPPGAGRPSAGRSLLPAPDGRQAVFVRDHNLWLQSTPAEQEPVETALTTDASATLSFRRDASRARLLQLDYDRPDYPDDMADAHWSPDSAYVVALQTSQVPERRVAYVESTPPDQLQPRLHSYPYLKPGDPIPVSWPRLFETQSRREIPIPRELFPNPWSLEFLRWSADSRRFWLRYNERGHQNLRILEVEAATGTVRAIVEEHSDTFIHYSTDGKCELRWLRNSQLLWTSERSGWNHLYLYDMDAGRLLRAITSGDWNVRRIEHVDEDRGLIWFHAVGIRPEQDPYHEHFCVARLAGVASPEGAEPGENVVVLTEGDGTHEIEWSPDRQVFLDRWSRVDLPPVTELRRSTDGQLICRLETADAAELLAAGGQFPERFVAKGRDGHTDIWGILHRPRDFQPTQRYPVLEQIYAGPHDQHVPKRFQARWRCQELADQGFIVVQIDGMGTAWRSRAFHDVCYRNLKDAGFPDRIAWIRAAAERFPELDLSRVGIYGGSAGGQNAVAALLWHHDFYKAAVADCGCHDNRLDKIWWNEQWMGLPEGDHYAANSNTEHAELLQGQLLLVVGEMDRNVDPASSAQLARRLIEADKDFQYLVIPGAGHGACETPWGTRQRLQFFQRTLQSAAAP